MCVPSHESIVYLREEYFLPNTEYDLPYQMDSSTPLYLHNFAPPTLVELFLQLQDGQWERLPSMLLRHSAFGSYQGGR